jgi:hypothetical protein
MLHPHGLNRNIVESMVFKEEPHLDPPLFSPNNPIWDNKMRQHINHLYKKNPFPLINLNTKSKSPLNFLTSLTHLEHIERG